MMSPSLHAEAVIQSAGHSRSAPSLFRIDRAWNEPGLHVIMGESGIGKSTLLKTLGGVWKPLSGRLLFEGRTLWAERGHEQDPALLARIGFCFQNNALFSSMSCLENLRFPRSRRRPDESDVKRRELSREWIARVGLAGTEDMLPHELSGGMQKRLAIARTLILEPEYIFFDDPTAGLDPITSRQIAELLSDLLKERAALSFVVTNDQDRARAWSSVILELRGGDLHERGPAL